jgi:FixJ family two-component response regulator
LVYAVTPSGQLSLVVAHDIVPNVKPVESTASLVAVVDDDESVRTALARALQSIGLKARSFASTEAFFASGVLERTGCVITDLQMSGMSGLELQAQLAAKGLAIPVIFISAFGEARLRSQAMEAGAVAFFDKPFDDNVLLETVVTVLGA